MTDEREHRRQVVSGRELFYILRRSRLGNVSLRVLISGEREEIASTAFVPLRLFIPKIAVEQTLLRGLISEERENMASTAFAPLCLVISTIAVEQTLLRCVISEEREHTGGVVGSVDNMSSARAVASRSSVAHV